MDETPLYLNMPPSTTVQKIGSKRVNIETQGQENWRVTAILTILASGEKLTPLLIFKTTEGNKQRKNCKNWRLWRTKKVFVYWQENARNSKSIMLRWIEDIWKKYSFFNLKWKTLLVLDNATTHNTNKVKEKIIKCEAYVSMIPSGITSKLQPMDISINKVFKENLRNKYVSYCIENNNLKVAKSTIIEWVDEIWYSDNY